MAIPNMAMIPSGYKPTKLYSVLPTPENGSEEVTNGDFSNGSTDWNLESGWSVADGKATRVATGSYTKITQGAILTVGKNYKVTFTVNEGAIGGIRVELGGTFQGDYNGVGTHTIYGISGSTAFNNFSLVGEPTFSGSVDNVSVEEVITADADFTVTRASSATRVNEQGLIETPEFIIGGDVVTNGDFSDGSTDWILGSGWSVSGGSATFVGSAYGASISQTNVVTLGKTYAFDCDLTDGFFDVRVGSNDYFEYTGQTIYVSADNSGSLSLVIRPRSSTVTIDNISVVEVERENIPRLDYTDGGCPVLLTEPQSTNLIANSSDFDNASWTKIRTLVTPNSVISPTGSVNASTLSVVGATGGEELIRIQSLDSNEASCSFYVKKGNWRYITLRSVNLSVFDFDTETFTLIGTDETLSFDKLNNGWYRLKASSPTRSYCSIGFAANAITPAAGVGVDGTNMYIWGAQMESLPYATSYMPTYGAISTRAGETVTNAGDVNTFNSEEGVLFVEMAGLVDGGSGRWISISDGTGANRVSIAYGSSSTNIRVYVSNSSGVVFDYQLSGQTQINFNKVAVKWKINDFALWVNGVEVASESSGTTYTENTLNSLQLDSGGGSSAFYGKTSQVQVFNTALSDAELITLTTI